MVTRLSSILSTFLLAFLLPFLLALTLPHAASAAVSAQLSAQDIDELESVRLTIRATETRQTETLDLSHLEADFHVMGTNTSSQYRFRNGREQSWVDYQITLQPKRTGVLKIPSIKVGREETPEISLRVRALSLETREKIKELVFFETELSKSEVYVQAQVIFTRRLLYSEGVQLYSDLPGAPELPNAVVLTLGETSAGSVRRDGKVYGVVEQRYAIFPEASGRLVLPAISVTASVRLVENNRYSRKGVRVGTSESVIYVLPVPAGYPSNQPWLPAEDVVLHQEIDTNAPVNVGDTVTHELLVHIKGNVGSIAPPVTWSVPENELRTYPQSPVINDDTNSKSVTGSRLQTTSIVALQPGQIEIPSQEIYWWNTETNELAITRSSALTLSAEGQAIVQSDPVEDAREPTSNNERLATEALDWSQIIELGKWLGALALLGVIAFSGIRLMRSVRLNKQPDTTSKIKNAGSPGELLGGIAVFLGDQTRQLALTRFRGTSEEHADFLAQLEAQAYAGDDCELDPQSRKKALSLASQVLEQSSKLEKKQARTTLPPLYDWKATS